MTVPDFTDEHDALCLMMRGEAFCTCDDVTAPELSAPHFVTIRLEYQGATPWKRRGRCTCGWQCLSWDGLRPILIAADHVAVARRFEALVIA